jgi:3-hydroxybutyryl-CoA dehydrogenase
MRIALISNDLLHEELLKRNNNIEWIRINGLEEWSLYPSMDALFVLDENAILGDYSMIKKPVFIHSVVEVLQAYHHPDYVVRINAWPGFLDRNHWEISGIPQDFHKLFEAEADVKLNWIPDEPGFVTARAIAMIINEAYFAKTEGVSETTDIDIALKLGTNYPWGPFEWAKKIGAKNVYEVLKKLSEKDNIYQPCIELEKSARA